MYDILTKTLSWDGPCVRLTGKNIPIMYNMWNSPHHAKSSEILNIKPFMDNNPLSETWTEDVLTVLNNIRINSILLSKYHKGHYLVLQGKLRYFRIPIIILSAISSLFNLGLAQYMTPQDIALLCAILSLITGLIGSIELYLQLQRSMENSLVHSRDFYLLAVEIQKCLLLSNENRNGDAVTYLNFKFNDYTRLIETSNIVNSEITDELTTIPIDVIIKMPYDERIRNNFMIDEKQFMENYQNYEISMGVNDISNIFVPISPNNRRSRSESMNTINHLLRKNNSVTNLFNSMNSKLFSRMSSKNADNVSRNNSRIFDNSDNSYNMNFI